MNIVKNFIVKDLINYEQNNNINIITELKNGEYTVIVDLLAIGNNIDINEAIGLFQELIKNYEYIDIVKSLSISIFGENNNSENGYVDTTNKTLSDILMDFYNEIHTIDDLDINSFLNMNTTSIYKYAEGVKQRYIYNINNRRREALERSQIDAGVKFGGLKEVPLVSEDTFMSKAEKKAKWLEERRREQGII
jgi:hypothetical protein